MGALSHGGTLRVLRYLGSFKNLHTRGVIQTEKGGVFSQGGKTLVRRIGAVRLHTEPVGQLGEEVVAGVLYAFLDVLAVMASEL